MEEKVIGVVIVLEGKAHTRSLFITCLQIDKSATAYCLIDYLKIWKIYTACGVPWAKVILYQALAANSSDVLRMIKTNENLINCVVHRVR